VDPTTESADPVPDPPADQTSERAPGAAEETRGGGAAALVLDAPPEGGTTAAGHGPDEGQAPTAEGAETSGAPGALPAPPPAPPDLPFPPDDLDAELESLDEELEQLEAEVAAEATIAGDVPAADDATDDAAAATRLATLPDPPVDRTTLPPPPARVRRRRSRRKVALVVVAVILVIPTVTYAQALTKEGQESFAARTAQWARDMQLGFFVDWAERRKFATDEYEDATGSPDATAFAPSQTTVTTAPTTTQVRSTTTTIPHLQPPARMIGPVLPMADGEGVWAPTGPLTQGMPGVYTTKVRPDTIHKQLTIFVAWIDPKLTSIELFPGTNLPGGKWGQPNFIPAERCPQAIMAANGGFRMDQSRGGYFAEGREPYKLRDGAASLVLYKDGRVDVGLWGRDVGREQLGDIASVRQNLEMMVDDGRPVPNLFSRDWGAELPNSYFVWRSAWGVTADGALVYIGGPALKPDDLAQHLVNAGAVRGMQGDINPEWVTSILYSTDGTGRCSGRRGLPGASNTGGMYSSDNRYLSTDTRDFIGVFAR
jgi:hypothetical protein